MAASQRNVDPKACIHRNGTIVMNWAHFCSAPDNLEKQAKALEIMEEIYSVPFESQSVVADLLVKEHEDLAPYMFYEAVRTGHAEVTKALKESGMVGFSYGPDRYDDAVYDCKKKQAEEVFALSDEESAEGVRKWLEEFPGDHKELLVRASFYHPIVTVLTRCCAVVPSSCCGSQRNNRPPSGARSSKHQ